DARRAEKCSRGAGGTRIAREPRRHHGLNMPRRVVVTGLGVVCPLGNDVATLWENLKLGRSGVTTIREFSTEKLRSDIAASVKDLDISKYMSPKEAEIYGRVTHFSLGAAVEAIEDAGLSPLLRNEEGKGQELSGVDRSKIGCLLSTGMGSVDIFEEQIEKSR